MEAMLRAIATEMRRSHRPATGAHAAAIENLLVAVRSSGRGDAGGHLADRIASTAEESSDLRVAVADVIATIAGRLAVDDDPPHGPPAHAALWRALVSAVDRLHGSGVAFLGRLPFVSDELLEAMRVEARRALPEHPSSSGRDTGSPGRLLAHLAVSRRLQEVIGTALARPVAPGLQAVYLRDPPGSHVRTHLDRDEYEVTFHLILEHAGVNGSRGSALVAHLPGSSEPTRLHVAPGEAVALCGRGTLHSWQRLGPQEHRMMVGIGWASPGPTRVELHSR